MGEGGRVEMELGLMNDTAWRQPPLPYSLDSYTRVSAMVLDQVNWVGG